MKKKKYLITRFGGIGDTAPVMAVARYLKNQGHMVDLALREDEHGQKQIDLLENTDCCNNAFSLREYGPSKVRSIPYKHGWVDIRKIYPDYDEILDYMFIIESNDVCRSSFQTKPTDEWKKHRNSNWQNWYDLHYSWAHINPDDVKQDDKRPFYKLSDEELAEVVKIKEGYSDVFVINPHASSLARTWYQAQGLVPRILDEYDNPLIMLWKPKEASWSMIDRKGTQRYTSPLKSSLRASVCVVGAADIYVGADTGFTHVAEGLGIEHIAIYSSVPWWTRALYYKHQHHVDKGPHTFALTLGDPIRIEEGFEKLTKKEKKIIKLQGSGMAIEKAALDMNTTPEGIAMELEAIKTKMAACERIQSKSLTSVSVDEIFEMMKKLKKKELKELACKSEL